MSKLPNASDDFPTRELQDKGLLWLINRVVFHPRGFALALLPEVDGTVTHLRLLGDGTETITFDSEDDEFRAAEATFTAARDYAAQLGAR